MLSREEVADALSKLEGLDGEIFIRAVPVPMVAPSSQAQAAMWSQHFWPSVYRKNNPQGPHPSMITRYTDEIVGDAAIWMTLAHQIAKQGSDAGLGEPMGACIVQRDEGKATVIALCLRCSLVPARKS